MPPSIARSLPPTLARSTSRAIGGARLPWSGDSGGAVGEPLWYAHGFTDSDYYQSVDGAGRGAIGTVRLVGVLLSLPGFGQKVLVNRCVNSGQGWRIQTGLSLDTISVIAGTAFAYGESPRHTFAAGDVGDLFVLHGWVDAGGLHMAIAGAEIGTGTPTIACTDPGGTNRVTLGRYQYAGGLSCPHVGIVSLCASPTAMTLSQIAADAAAIMSSGSRLVLPTMPGEDMRFVAFDAEPSGGDWHDRDGDDCTLTENGAVSFTAVP
jgi:hypothetical protein